MTKKGLIWFIAVYFILMLISHYLFILIGLLIRFLILLITFGLSVIQLLTLIGKNRFTKIRIQTTVVFILLFLLTFFKAADYVIEKIDWHVLYNKRVEIVEQIKQKKLNQNADWNEKLCQLPFRFPIVSNSGNDIIIIRDSSNSILTVKFFINRGMFDDFSDYFVYSNDPKEIRMMENFSKNDPRKNWKLKDNWYRIEGF